MEEQDLKGLRGWPNKEYKLQELKDKLQINLNVVTLQICTSYQTVIFTITVDSLRYLTLSNETSVSEQHLKS